MYYKESQIYIKELNRSTRLYIGLPDDYETSSKRYPVLYMHDGHNVFSDKDSFSGVSWGIIDAYKKDKTLPEIIVVALECAEDLGRFDEYSPFEITHPDFLEYSKGKTAGGNGDNYLSYISKVLKPQIDAEYRTLKEPEHTGIMGSSMGGFISLYAGLKFNNVFTRIGAVSGSYFVALEEILKTIKAADLKNIKKLYMDYGTQETGVVQESDYEIANKAVFNSLNEKLTPNCLKFEAIEGGIHHESAWAKRLPNILKYLFD